MSIHYSIAYQQVVPTYVCQEASVRRAEKSASACRAGRGSGDQQSLAGTDAADDLQVALAVQQEVEARLPKQTRCGGSTLNAHSTRPNCLAAGI